MKSFSINWVDLLSQTVFGGEVIVARRQKTYEVLNRTIEVDMRRPVLMVPSRKLSYVFMLAEAHWILSGDDRVSTIKPYNANIANFSDDGQIFFGAYGPKIAGQIRYVVEKLKQDMHTRQAGLTTWRENPPETKDVPCTIAMFFNIRAGVLNCHVFMRSSDIWLGVPYDVFNFAMVSHLVCALYNNDKSTADMVKPGTLYLTAVSSHLYHKNLADAQAVYRNPGDILNCEPTPDSMWQDSNSLISFLGELKDLPPDTDKRWWIKRS